MGRKSWEEIKGLGSVHYKPGGQVEPIDLYLSMGILKEFAIANIIKYASRNVGSDRTVKCKDMDKIIHYAEMLKSAYGEEEE